MTPRTRRIAGWSVGAVVGVVAGVLLGIATHDWQEAREARDVELRAEEFARTEVVPPPGDAVRALVEQDALVAVDPLLVDRVPEDDVRRGLQSADAATLNQALLDADRLLIDVFATRDALYAARESTPIPHPRARVVLLGWCV